uniref:Transmembrane emp24 domain-containing protein 5 n=1 Tax=Cacopsylla melanoneura TaxID=428564 RepID=A0A8D8V1H8_9HEMI
MNLQTLLVVTLLFLTSTVSSSELLLSDGRSRSISLTTVVQPGYSDCFYEPLRHGSKIGIDYQVLSTDHDDNHDISFQMRTPSGRTILEDFKMTDKTHEHVVDEEGVYEFCFDNTFSTFSEKVVFFEFYIEPDINDIPELHESDRSDEKGVDLNDFHHKINSIHNSLVIVRHLQEISRASENNDYRSIQSKASKVTNWSLLQISVMIVVALVQVVLVRSLIDEKSKFHVIWNFIFGRHA